MKIYSGYGSDIYVETPASEGMIHLHISSELFSEMTVALDLKAALELAGALTTAVDIARKLGRVS